MNLSPASLLPVPPQKAQKIDLSIDYPCPCRRRGRIIPLTLMEAFGCNRCQQIFVVQENGHVIEQASTHYPYKRMWRWTGHQWHIAHSGLSRGYFPLTLLLIFGLVFLLLLTMLQLPLSSNLTFRVAAALVLSMMLVLMLWLACRR